MPRFSYEAADPSGGLYKDVIEAPTRGAAVAQIVARGRTPVRLAELDGATAGAPTLDRLLPHWNIAGDRLEILRELSVLLAAGLTVERALVVMQGLTAKARVRGVLAQMLAGLRGGDALSAAMSRADHVFPETMRKLVTAGEASGRLADVTARLARVLTRNKELGERVLSALVYPMLLLVVMVAVLVVIFTVVLPRLEPLFLQSGDALPWPAAGLIAVSHFFNTYGLWLILALIVALAGALYAMRRPEVQLALDRFAATSRVTLDLPRRYESAQICRNLAMLLEGGMPLNRALESAEAAMTNRYMRTRMNIVLEQVRQGRPLGAALEAAVAFPRPMIEFATVGEETGRLGQMMNEAAEVLDRDVQTLLDRLTALLLPAVTILLGLVVAAIMSGVVGGILAANDLAL